MHDPLTPRPPQKKNNQDLVEGFFAPEEVDLTCSECQEGRAQMLQRFTALPRVVVLHLKRFRFHKGVSRKLEDRVAISEVLCLKVRR